MFNNTFGEDDACELVAIGFRLKEYNCRWTTNGHPCNAMVPGDDMTNHLRIVHGTNETSRVECLWNNCGEILNRGTLVRHVQERHLEYRWPCPKCNTLFTRRGVMDTHRATCNGMVN